MKKAIIQILESGLIITDPITNKHLMFNRGNNNLYEVSYGDRVNDYESNYREYNNFTSAYRYFKK